jgi:hypothetical protein
LSTHERVDRSRDPAKDDDARSTREALDRARVHLRTAIAEGLEAAREIVEATSLATNGSPAKAHPALRRITISLDELASKLAGDAALVPPPLAAAVLDALDEEIGRWELRSQTDPEARPVLRAFLGMREILWEFGLRRDPAKAAPGSKAARGGQASRPEPTATGRARVQRVDVEG